MIGLLDARLRQNETGWFQLPATIIDAGGGRQGAPRSNEPERKRGRERESPGGSVGTLWREDR